MDGILVVFYSYTGTSRRLVQLLCRQFGWPSGEILEEQPRSGVSGALRCVADSLLRRQPPIRYRGLDPMGFETVVLVSPIWAYRLASPMRSFVAQRRDDLQQVGVVSVMGGSGAPNAVAEISHLLGRAPLLSVAVTTREVDDGSCVSRVEAFGHALQTASRQSSPVSPASWTPLTG